MAIMDGSSIKSTSTTTPAAQNTTSLWHAAMLSNLRKLFPTLLFLKVDQFVFKKYIERAFGVAGDGSSPRYILVNTKRESYYEIVLKTGGDTQEARNFDILATVIRQCQDNLVPLNDIGPVAPNTLLDTSRPEEKEEDTLSFASTFCAIFGITLTFLILRAIYRRFSHPQEGYHRQVSRFDI
jgi:hypothetical protein